MSRRRSRHSAERNRRLLGGLFKLAFFLGSVGVTGFYAYQVGIQLARAEVSALQAEVDRLGQEARAGAETLGKTTQELQAARAEAADFKQRYEAVVPTPEMTALMQVAQGKMAAGVPAQRLQVFLKAADRPKNCRDALTKRFLVKTPSYDGENTWVRFNDLITVAATGKGGNGGAEQWFDPEADVSVSFTPIGGQADEVSGKLPLQHSMVVSNREYRFTIAPGARGFVEVTGDRCDFKA